MMSSGLVQRKRGVNEAVEEQDVELAPENYDNEQDLTLMEEIVLLGLKDNDVFQFNLRDCSRFGMTIFRTFCEERF
jgi:hypothetical protein